MSGVMLSVCLPIQPQVLSCCQRKSDQQCSTTARESRLQVQHCPVHWACCPWWGQTKHTTMQDLVEHPHGWVQAYAGKMEEPPSWWQEFQSLYWGCTGGLGETKVQELAKRQTASFRLAAAQDEESGWWNPPPSLSALGCNDFLPHRDFQGM